MKSNFSRLRGGTARLAISLTFAIALSACGGGEGDPARTASSTEADVNISQPGEAAVAQPRIGSDASTDATETMSKALASASDGSSFSDNDASRLMTQATFGPTASGIAWARSVGSPAAWVDQKMSIPYDMSQSYVTYVRSRMAAGEKMHQNLVFENFWKQALTSPDQLRHRMAFALSQIFVVSFAGTVGDEALGVASYYDMLGQQAFGNYRQVLENVTRHPMMGLYLSHLANVRENPTTGTVPDENFAREVMQLFSIGLYQLNIDGTVKMGTDGKPIETYTNNDIQGLAKVFTGWSWAGPDKTKDRFFGYPNAWDLNRSLTPMQGYPQYHSFSEKKFLGVTIPAQSSPADPAASLKIALDTIAAHPNVAPFISKQLIQRFVTSNPSPAYVARVAKVFNNNGVGVRGDLKATLRAILLDSEARSKATSADPTFGKLKEPLLRVTAWLRAFNATSLSGRYLVHNTDDAAQGIGQTVLRSPTVFNFYRPGYVPPETAIASADRTSPEMQIATDVSATAYVNLMANSVMWGYGIVNGAGKPDLQPSYSTEVSLVGNPDQLLDRLNTLLFAGRMSASLKAQVKSVMNSLPIGQNAKDVSLFKGNRAQLAILLCLVSPEFIVQK